MRRSASRSAPRTRNSEFQFASGRQEQARDFLAEKSRVSGLVGGSRSGKTTLIVRAIMTRAVRVEQSRHLIARFRYNACRASIGLDTVPKVRDMCFPGLALRERAEGYFELPNGSEIWLGGLDEKERVEKILGQEYVSIYGNESSQIPYSSWLVLVTRLAQVCPGLRQRAYLDLNPVGKSHWTRRLLIEKIDPLSRQPLSRPEDYGAFFLNPEDNARNLDPAYLASLDDLPERHRRRFKLGEYQDEVENALWTMESIDRSRLDLAPGQTAEDVMPVSRRRRVVIAVDPSGAKDAHDVGHDPIGICGAALGEDGHGYLLEDNTLLDSPAVWGRRAVEMYHRLRADRVVAEANFGGEMVRHVIQSIDGGVPVHLVSASRGKAVRAEPISALAAPTERWPAGRIHHVGAFPELEDELCAFSTLGYTGPRSPNRADAYVWAFTELMASEQTTGMLAVMEQQAAAKQRDVSPSSSFSWSMKIGSMPGSPVRRLRPPAGGSTAYGMTGKMYAVGPEGWVDVDDTDATPLIGAGWQPVD